MPLFILRLIPGGPAHKTNLIQVGDIIEAINGQNIGKLLYIFNFSILFFNKYLNVHCNRWKKVDFF